MPVKEAFLIVSGMLLLFTISLYFVFAGCVTFVKMLKKSGIVLVALLYLITANGFAINLHFCGKSIASFKINESVKNCGMSSKCCKNTHVEVKVKDAHQTSHTSFTAQNLVFLVPVFNSASLHQPLIINLVPQVVSERGPPLPAVPVYLKNCTFRI